MLANEVERRLQSTRNRRTNPSILSTFGIQFRNQNTEHANLHPELKGLRVFQKFAWLVTREIPLDGVEQIYVKSGWEAYKSCGLDEYIDTGENRYPTRRWLQVALPDILKEAKGTVTAVLPPLDELGLVERRRAISPPEGYRGDLLSARLTEDGKNFFFNMQSVLSTYQGGSGAMFAKSSYEFEPGVNNWISLLDKLRD